MPAAGGAAVQDELGLRRRDEDDSNWLLRPEAEDGGVGRGRVAAGRPQGEYGLGGRQEQGVAIAAGASASDVVP